MSAGGRIAVFGAIGLAAIGSLYLWISRGAAILLDMSWTTCL